MKALTYAVYAITILLCPNPIIEQTLGCSRSRLLQSYQRAAEVALHHCNFMASRSLASFQALLYLIVSLYEHKLHV